jgi:uncharacterized membrane protein YkoI
MFRLRVVGHIDTRSYMMTFGKKLTAIMLCGAITTGAAAATLSPARAFTGEELAAQAKLTLDEARAIALKVFAGEIASEELEKEKGGSGLRYSFDIKNGSVVHEVGVDAKTGKILENIVERAGH